MNQRELRGKQIVERDDQIKRLNETHYKINSQSRDKTHDVVGTEIGWVCSCEDHQFRKVCCKHIHAVEISLKLRKAVKKSIVIDTVNLTTCQFCNSENLKKAGIRKNKTHNIQIYQCKDCLKRFSFNLGFEGMHASCGIPKSVRLLLCMILFSCLLINNCTPLLWHLSYKRFGWSFQSIPVK